MSDVLNRSWSLNDSLNNPSIFSDEGGNEMLKKSYTFTANLGKKKLNAEEPEKATDKEKVVVNNIQTIGKPQSKFEISIILVNY